MEASIVDLRYKMHEVLRALSHNEKVKITYHGKEQGVIHPSHDVAFLKRVQEHPFFGMTRNDERAVKDVMEELRKGRYDTDVV